MGPTAPTGAPPGAPTDPQDPLAAPGAGPGIAPAPPPPPDAGTAVASTLRDTLHAFVVAEAQDAGIPPEWALAHLQAETSGGTNVHESTAHAKGPMQLTDRVARLHGIDPSKPVDWAENVHAGVRELAALSDRFNGDLVLASAGYNSNADKVEARVARGGLRGLPPETQVYLGRIAEAYPGLFDSRNAAPLPVGTHVNAPPAPSTVPGDPHGGGTGEWTADVPGFFRDMVVPLAANAAETTRDFVSTGIENIALGTIDDARTVIDPNAPPASRIGAGGTLAVGAIPGVGPWGSALIFGAAQILRIIGGRQQAAQDAGTPVDVVHAAMSISGKDAAEAGAAAIALGIFGRLFGDNSFRGLKGVGMTKIQAVGSEARRASGAALAEAPAALRAEAEALLAGAPSPAAGTVTAAFESIPRVRVDATAVADAIDTHLAAGRTLPKTVTTIRDGFQGAPDQFVPVWEAPVGFNPPRMSLTRIQGDGYTAQSSELLSLNQELGKHLNPKYAAESGTSAGLGDLRALKGELNTHIGSALDTAVPGGGAKFAAARDAGALAAEDRRAAGLFVKYLNPTNGLFNPVEFGAVLRKVGTTKAIGESNQAYLLRATDALGAMTEKDPSVAASLLHALWTGERVGAMTAGGVAALTGGEHIAQTAAQGGVIGLSAVVLARAARVATRVFTDARVVKEMEFLAKGAGTRTGVMAEHLGRVVSAITAARALDELQQAPPAAPGMGPPPVAPVGPPPGMGGRMPAPQ